jgi:hypothetical protein
MASKAPRPWTVTRHGELEKLDDNLWSVQGDVPGLPLTRRMAIVRRSDGTLTFFNAVPLAEKTLAEVLAWGKPSLLVIPHDQHGIDAAPFAERLGLKIYGPKKSEAKMRARWSLAGTIEDMPADPDVRFESLDGAKTGEPVGIVRSSDRASLLFADAYQDATGTTLPVPLRILGFGGGPKVVPVFRMLFTSDKKALRAHFERLAALTGLTRIVPCHGAITTREAPETLRRVAAAL